MPIKIDPGHPINANLAGWWPMDEGSGTVANDISGLGNHGAFSGGVSWATSYINGKNLSFDGVDGQLVMTHNSTLAITGNMTMVVWAKYAAWDWHMFLTKTNGGTAGPYMAYVNASRGTIEFHRGNGTLHDYIESTDPGPLSTWHCVAVTMSGTTVTHYLNGASNGSGTLSTTIGDSATDMRFGNRPDGFWLTGEAANVRLFSRALAASEIAALYSDPFLGRLRRPLSSDRLYNRSLSRIWRRGETG